MIIWVRVVYSHIFLFDELWSKVLHLWLMFYALYLIAYRLMVSNIFSCSPNFLHMSITEFFYFFYFTAVATKFNVCLCVVSDTVRKQLQKRAIKTMMGLGKHFQTLDRSGDGVLDKQELKQALAFYHIQVPDEVWRWEGGNFTEYFCILAAPPNSNIIRVCKSIL